MSKLNHSTSIMVRQTLLFVCFVGLSLSDACLASGYHVYDWKGDGKEKKGKLIRESRWQPGFVVTKAGERQEGDLMVETVDGRIAEVSLKADGSRKQTFVTADLKDFGLLLSDADLEKSDKGSNTQFGPGVLELSDGQELRGVLGAASLEDGEVFSISYAADRSRPLVSYFSRSVRRAVMTIDGIDMEYLPGDDGFSKVPTLAEHRTFQHPDNSRNPHEGVLLLSNGERIEGPLLLVKDEDNGPAHGAMIFYEDGYGIFWVASELARVTQVIGGQSHYWSSYGASLERLPRLREYATNSYRDSSRNAHPGKLLLRDGTLLKGSLAFIKTKDNVSSIELFYFDEQGIPFSYGGTDISQATQTINQHDHHYIPYQDLVFVELMAEGSPYQIHANPFPEREDQFKTAATRGLLSALVQVAASQLGQEGLGNVISLGGSGCGTSILCSSHNSLRDGVESMVPDYKKDEFVFRGANRQETILFKKTFEDEIEPLLERCAAFAQLSRKEKKALLDFDDPGRAVSFLNSCTDALASGSQPNQANPVSSDAGTVFEDRLRNGGHGPSMVVVPAGSFQMGDPSGRQLHEIPQHRVRFSRPIAVSRYEVTLQEFDAFTASTGRVRRTGQLSKQPGSAVRGIAWMDAVAYTQWLSVMTGQNYRLPTEAEWEYVARAGTSTRYPWGDDISRNKVQCEACGDKKLKSEDVGQFPHNAFGLFDVSGGAWEWVADCWHTEYSGAPTDGSAWMDAGDCNLRTLRGGSVNSPPEHMTVTFRTASNPVNRGEFAGFRVVRDFQGPSLDLSANRSK